MSHRPAAPSHRRRSALAGLLLAAAQAAFGSRADAPTLDLWVDLSEPVAADATDAVDRQRRGERVAQQQDAVLARLRELGALELARVRHTRNAVAVRIEASRAEAMRRIPGVVRLRPARSLHPPKPMP